MAVFFLGFLCRCTQRMGSSLLRFITDRLRVILLLLWLHFRNLVLKSALILLVIDLYDYRQ